MSIAEELKQSIEKMADERYEYDSAKDNIKKVFEPVVEAIAKIEERLPKYGDIWVTNIVGKKDAISFSPGDTLISTCGDCGLFVTQPSGDGYCLKHEILVSGKSRAPGCYQYWQKEDSK